MRTIFLETGKGAALLVIALLCILTGLVAATGRFPWESLFDKTIVTLVLFYLCPNVIFLAYRQMFSSPKYRKLEKGTEEPKAQSVKQWMGNWIGVTATAMGLIVFVAPDIYWKDLLAAFVMTFPLFYYCYKSYQLYRSAHVEGSIEDTRQQSFENLIFIPAFLLCIVNFSLGLFLSRRMGLNGYNLFAYLSTEDIPYLLGSYAIIDLYYRWQVRAAYIYAACPLGVVIFGLFSFYAFGLTSAKFLALAVMITFFIGFGEVAKHLYFIGTKNPNYIGDPRKLEFFLQGANWSGIVYPTLFLLSPAIFLEMSFLPIVIVVYLFVLIWLALTEEQKRSRVALITSFAVGYGTPVAFMISIAQRSRFFEPPITDQTHFQTLLALIALIGFMAGLLRLTKDLFGLNLAAFTRNVWTKELYSNDAACLFLLLAMSLVVCIILTCAWLVLFIFPATSGGEARVYSTRLALVGVSVVVLSVLAVIISIFRPTKLASLITAAEQINTMNLRGNSKIDTSTTLMINCDWKRSLKLLLMSARVGASWIAGLVVAIVVYRSSSFSFEKMVCGFLSLSLVTMSGFVMNDIYDREKDRMAGKTRPLAMGHLSVTNAWQGVAVLLLFALGLAYLAYGLVASLWLVVIASALFAYSPMAKRFPLVKGLYTASLVISPFLFAYDVMDFSLPLTVLFLLWAYIVFREIVLDAVDLKGDVAFGLRTVAAVLGARMSFFIGWIGMCATLFVSLFLMESVLSRLFACIAILVQLIATGMFVWRLRYSLGMTRITMISGVLAASFST